MFLDHPNRINGQVTPGDTTLTTHEQTPHIIDYEDHFNEIEARTPTYEIDRGDEIDRNGRGPSDYGYEHEITTKWYHPKTTDNRVVPPESEFFATIVGK